MQNDTICVEQDSKIYFRMPLHNLDSVVVLGNVLVSQPLLSRLVELNIDVSFHHINGGFRYRITGPLNGNILLRLAQFEAYNDKSKATEITKRILASKIRNSRYVLSRGSRDVPDDSLSTELKDASEILGSMLGTLETMTDINSMRGLEGSAASVYFKVFDCLISSRCKDFSFNTRSRRPPRDR
ncbi:MAG TPA: CRISPR-associated endonuclease Cas1, partial [Caldisericia bacterium]|nr:CRISPR-associated endonuclease Cas1 [Caldisericia bacterium]